MGLEGGQGAGLLMSVYTSSGVSTRDTVVMEMNIYMLNIYMFLNEYLMAENEQK